MVATDNKVYVIPQKVSGWLERGQFPVDYLPLIHNLWLIPMDELLRRNTPTTVIPVKPKKAVKKVGVNV